MLHWLWSMTVVRLYQNAQWIKIWISCKLLLIYIDKCANPRSSRLAEFYVCTTATEGLSFRKLCIFFSITRELLSFEIYLSCLKWCLVSRNSLENIKKIALCWDHVSACLSVCMLSDCDLVFECNSQTSMFKIWHWKLSLKAVGQFRFSVILIYNKVHFTLSYKWTFPCTTNAQAVKTDSVKILYGRLILALKECYNF